MLFGSLLSLELSPHALLTDFRRSMLPVRVRASPEPEPDLDGRGMDDGAGVEDLEGGVDADADSSRVFFS